MHGDASLATRSCLCGRLFVNDFEKNIGENQPRIGRIHVKNVNLGRPIYRSITTVVLLLPLIGQRRHNGCQLHRQQQRQSFSTRES